VIYARNITIKNNETLWFNLNATDMTDVNEFSWRVNDTDFNMTTGGNLTNASNLTVGYHYLNVSVNDTLDNVGWILMWVRVNESNRQPLAVNLTAPADNSTIINRTPLFSWNASRDPDGDDIWYNLIVDDTETFDFPEINISTNLTNYTDISELSFGTYYWMVTASDNRSVPVNSSKFNFTLISAVVISLPNETISFGTIASNGTNDTTDENPYPFVIQNDGNCEIDIHINSTGIWRSVGLNTSYYQIKADNTTETGAFNWTASVTSWLNITNETLIIKTLQHNSTIDTAEVDIRIDVPPDEPAGDKRDVMTFIAMET
jgi:hypothetical protein